MPFNDNLPPENTDPWYAGITTAWSNLKTFINGLEAALSGKESSLTAGTNITINRTNPAAPVISATGGAGAVSSVNTKTGAVVLNAADVGAATAAQGAKADTAVQPAAITNLVPNTRTVAGKALTGNVTLVAGDVGAATAAQGALAATAVQPAAITNLVPNTRTVAGKALTANVTLAKGDVGLGNVDNTSDANKPVSTAQAAAIDAKVGSPNASVSGVALYPTVSDFPAVGTPGVIYFAQAE